MINNLEGDHFPQTKTHVQFGLQHTIFQDLLETQKSSQYVLLGAIGEVGGNAEPGEVMRSIKSLELELSDNAK